MEYFKFLPVEITLDILNRLPTESILDCKLVSKTWNNLVRDPSFSKMQLNHPYSHNSGKLSFVFRFKCNFRQLHYLEYNENQENMSKSRRINLTLPFRCYSVLGSFNGLVCLYGCHPSQDREFFGPACVCNPMTKEYIILPKCETPANLSCGILLGGFGYLPSTNEYKVVRIMCIKQGEANFIEVEVYTLGSGKGWRNLGKLDCSLDTSHGAYGAFANGALHWIDMEQRIVDFDLAEEEFRGHLRPPYLTRPNLEAAKLGVWDGFLLYSVSHFEGNSLECEIWILKTEKGNCDMKGHERHQSLVWSKQLTLVPSTPFAFTQSGYVLRYLDCCLYMYDPKSSTSLMLVDFGKEIRQVLPHNNSLVSIKELGEEDTKILESGEIEEVQRSDMPAKQL